MVMLFFVGAFIPQLAVAKTFLALEPGMPSVPHLLEELERVLGREHREEVESRGRRLEEIMRPTFLALPKDAAGNIGLSAARYLLHRIFVQRHGWFVRGLVSSGDSWNSSSPVDAVAMHLQDGHADLFAEHIQESISLHHTAVLAATLEGQVHSETLERLRSAFRIAGLSSDSASRHASKDVLKAIDTYMLFYVAGLTNHTRATARLVDAIFGKIDDAYPMWEETKSWASGVASEAMSSNSNDVNFDDSVRAVEAIADQYGRWQNKECLDLKASMMKMEENGTGRVPLEVFYQSALDGQWQFSESKPYLQQLGALDASVPSRPSVIISNYVNGPSNCVAASSFYSVCCIDECESLLAHIEMRVADPAASPEFIAEIVSNLPSSTVPAPRQLSAQHLQLLEDVAAQHEGMVPLHSRLFSQWLHHVYPRECQFPHLSGTTKPMTAREWKAETGEVSTVSSEVMLQHIERIQQSQADLNAEPGSVSVPWHDEEELFIGKIGSHQGSRSSRSLMRTFVYVALLLSMGGMLVKGATTSVEVLQPQLKCAKYMV